MHKIFLTTTFLFFTITATLAQDENELIFTVDLLDHPIANSEWFDEGLTTIYVDKYNAEQVRTISLANGYALFALEPSAIFPLLGNGLIPIEVDIVYSHYPLSKDDWRTNYYELLANRVKELIGLDSSLNSPQVQWRLVKQTSCTNELQAQRLFHGVVIRYKHSQPKALKAISDIVFSLPDFHLPRTVLLAANVVDKEVIDDEQLKSILYPSSVYNRDMKQYIPPVSRRKGEPGCPTFTTRAHRPRQSIWARLFR